MICVEDGRLVSLNIIPGIEYTNYTYVKPIDVGFTPLSSIVIYNEIGVEIGSLGLPDTDSTVFWAANMIQLQDGRICVGGDFVNVNTESHNAFFAIINTELTAFDKIEILEENTPLQTVFIKEAGNGNILFYTNNGIREYSTTGYLSYIYGIPQTILMDSIFYFSFHSFNNKKYSFYGNGTYSIRYYEYDENNIGSYTVISDSNMYPHQQYPLSFSYSTRGKKTHNKAYLINVIAGGPNGFYTNVLKIDSQGNFSIFFTDTLTIGTGFSTLTTTLDLHDENYIYLVYQTNLTSYKYIIYCLQKDGSLRWKKTIDLNPELTTNNNTGNITAMAATKDKGVIFTVSAFENSSNADVYYCKLDSLGNPIDFNTNIQEIDVYVNDFLLYPNPSRQFLNIKTSLQQKYTIVLFNINGKQVLQENIKNGSQVNISQFTKGIYFYSITDTNNKEIQKGKFVMK